jgi:hypothetical protein
MFFKLFGFTFGTEPIDAVGLTATGRAKVGSALSHLLTNLVDLDFTPDPFEGTAGDRTVGFFFDDAVVDQKAADQEAVMLLVHILRFGIPDKVSEAVEGTIGNGSLADEEEDFGTAVVLPFSEPTSPLITSIDEQQEVIARFHKSPTIDKFTYGGLAELMEDQEMEEVNAVLVSDVSQFDRPTHQDAAVAAGLQRIAVEEARISFPPRLVSPVPRTKRKASRRSRSRKANT